MAEKILMIALSPTMETGTIGTWVKEEGDTVAAGEVLCEVETDKATMEYESMQEGTLLKIIVPEGGVAAIGEPIGIIGETEEDISGILAETERPAGDTGPAAPEKGLPAGAVGPGGPGGTGEHVKSSPLARALAGKYGIDVSAVHGSGPDGRVVKRDIEKAARRQGAAAGPGPAGSREETAAAFSGLPPESRPVSQKRKVIARRLSESKFSAPHYYLRLQVVMDSLLEERKLLNQSRQEKISFNSFLIKTAAETLKRHPRIRSSWQEDSIITYNSIDIGLAVAQEDGLITPVVRDCGSKGIISIDRELKELIARARSNKLSAEEYTGAVFTISNLGTYGIDEFTAIINPPASAILAVGAINSQPAVSGAGEEESLRIAGIMTCTLSCDHRVIDGAAGAGFLTDFKQNLEHPVRMMY